MSLILILLWRPDAFAWPLAEYSGKALFEFYYRICLTFPNYDNPPAGSPQESKLGAITGDICQEFLSPKFAPCFRRGCSRATQMPVPKTTVN